MKHSKHLGADIAGKDDSAALAANPAAREMIAHLDAAGVETLLDRLDAQQPQCGFGLRGLCCRMCQWGPCRITAKSPRGVCGRSMELVVMANLAARRRRGHLRADDARARDGAHAADVARGEIALDAQGARTGCATSATDSTSRCPGRRSETSRRRSRDVMLDDLGRLTDEPMRTLTAFAPEGAPRGLGGARRAASLGGVRDRRGDAHDDARRLLRLGGDVPAGAAHEPRLRVLRPRHLVGRSRTSCSACPSPRQPR